MMPVIEISLPAQPGGGGNVPAFLAKLWKMVDNPDTDELISWSADGSYFVIKNQGEFTKTMLPYYYKHSNMASFVRQLNMYGFHKVMNVESGGLKADRGEVEFQHPFFMRGQEHLLEQIKRKVNVGGRGGGASGLSQFVPNIKGEKVTEVLQEVGVLKERQEDLDNKLENMKSENNALWGEVMSLRQKHHQQQKIVNKLIQFLSALLQPRGMKRSFGGRGSIGSQLAIEDNGPGVTDVGPSLPKQAKKNGPIIHELPANLNASQLSDVLSNLSAPASVQSSIPSSEPIVDIIIDPETLVVPQDQVQVSAQVPSQPNGQVSHGNKYQMVDPVSVNSSLVKRPVLQREMSREDFDSVINTNEKDLDNLKDILSGQITLDTSLVSSLFSSEAEANNLNLFGDYSFPDLQTDASASDVKPVTYNPSLFELADDGEDEILPEASPFSDPSVLLTPMIQEDQTDPMKKLFNK